MGQDSQWSIVNGQWSVYNQVCIFVVLTPDSMKLLYTILLVCFCLVSASQAAVADKSPRKQAGITQVQVLPTHSLAPIEVLEDGNESDFLDIASMSVSETTDTCQAKTPKHHELDSHIYILRCDTPLYLIVRSILI
jgi:hypothetical protein